MSSLDGYKRLETICQIVESIDRDEDQADLPVVDEQIVKEAFGTLTAFARMIALSEGITVSELMDKVRELNRSN